jgi:hypothetical protein
MSIITKKIGKREYAYLVFREGKKVIQKYLGPASDPKVLKLMEGKRDAFMIPERLWPLFWDVNPAEIHVRRNARYIIERILELGDLTAVHWLHMIYPLGKIIDVLSMSRNLTEKAGNFWRIWFEVDCA